MHLLETIAHLFHPRRSNNHRPKLLHPEALIGLLFIAVGGYMLIQSTNHVGLPRGLVLGYASNISTTQVVELSNKERESAGLSNLTLNTQLSAAANAKAQDMFAHQYWAHTSPTGREPWDFIHESGYRYRVAGENLARDFMETPEMVSAWMASPTHRANIMNAKYSEIGVAVVNGMLNGTETTLVVQMFGTPTVAGAPPPTLTDNAATVELTNDQTAQPNQPATQPSVPQPSQAPAPNITNPVPSPQTVVDVELAQVVQRDTQVQPSTQPQILSRFLIPDGTLLPTIIFSPLVLVKALLLAIILLLSAVLLYDLAVIGNRSNVRLVGKNIAHLMLFFTVAFLVLFFRSGVVQ